MVPFGQNILLWRIHRGLTQEELAARARVSRPNLSAIERGRREVSLATLRALALALNVNPGSLVDGISPAVVQTPSFSRKTLERIAEAVWKGTPLPSAKGKKLASLLKQLLHSRKNLKRGKRSTERAWLQLKSAYPPHIIQTLIEKVRDREQIHGQKAH